MPDFNARYHPVIYRHNHITRDIKPLGHCPLCDQHHIRQNPSVIKAGVDVWMDRVQRGTVGSPVDHVGAMAAEMAPLILRIYQEAVADPEPERPEPTALGFRRRCGWCGVALRAWQRNLCRLCKPSVVLDTPSSPRVHGSRWNAEPDAWRWPWSRSKQ